MAEDAAIIHVPRNLLVHGKLYGSMEGQDYVLTAVGQHNGQETRAKFREPELLTLYYEIANLCGRIGFLFNPDDSPRKPQPFLPDEKHFLRELIQRNNPSLSSPHSIAVGADGKARK